MAIRRSSTKTMTQRRTALFAARRMRSFFASGICASSDLNSCNRLRPRSTRPRNTAISCFKLTISADESDDFMFMNSQSGGAELGGRMVGASRAVKWLARSPRGRMGDPIEDGAAVSGAGELSGGGDGGGRPCRS